MKGVYFKISKQIEAIDIGDIVSYEELFETEKGYMVKTLHFVK